MTFDDGIVSTHREVEAAPPGPWLSRIGDALRSTPLENPLAALRSLVERGLDDLPLPGSGRTLCRFRSLAAVAAHDLSLVKLYEGHTDALAILEELGGPPPPRGSTLGTWAAEARGMCVVATPLAGTSKVRLNGRKAWCSGAAGVSHAVVTVWGQKDDRKKSSDAGFDHHLVKPVDMEVLRRLLAGLRTATAE